MAEDIVNNLDDQQRIAVLKKAILKLSRVKTELEDKVRVITEERDTLRDKLDVAESALSTYQLRCDELEAKIGSTSVKSSFRNLLSVPRNATSVQQDDKSTHKKEKSSATARNSVAPDSSGGATSMAHNADPEILFEENERLHEQMFEMKTRYEQQLQELQARVLHLIAEREDAVATARQESNRAVLNEERYKEAIEKLQGTLSRTQISHEHACAVLDRKVVMHDCPGNGDLRFLIPHRPHPLMLFHVEPALLQIVQEFRVVGQIVSSLLSHTMEFQRTNYATTSRNEMACSIGTDVLSAEPLVDLRGARDVLQVHTDRLLEYLERPPLHVESVGTEKAFVHWIQCLEDSLVLVSHVLGQTRSSKGDQDSDTVLPLVKVLREWNCWCQSHRSIWKDGLTGAMGTQIHELMNRTVAASVDLSKQLTAHLHQNATVSTFDFGKQTCLDDDRSSNNLNFSVHGNQSSLNWVLLERIQQACRQLHVTLTNVINQTTRWMGEWFKVEVSNARAFGTNTLRNASEALLTQLLALGSGVTRTSNWEVSECVSETGVGDLGMHTSTTYLAHIYTDIIPVNTMLRNAMFDYMRELRSERDSRMCTNRTTLHEQNPTDLDKGSYICSKGSGNTGELCRAIFYADSKAIEYYMQWQRSLQENMTLFQRLTNLEAEVIRQKEEAERKDQMAQDVLGNYATQVQMLTERIVELEDESHGNIPLSWKDAL